MGEPLHESTIKHALGDRPVSVRVLSVTDSTNNEAKRHALSGTDVPTAIFAEEQTAGRGRMGRSFFSPPHTGIYLSLLLPDSGVLTDTVDLTTGQNTRLSIHGRHDPCIVHRAVPVIEAAAALACCQLLFL